jgi:hypothetical protein
MAVGHPTPADALSLLNLLAPQELQALQDSLAPVAELHLSFATPAGQALTDPAPLPPLCRLLRQSVCREPEALCAFAATPLRRQLADGDGPVFAECPYLGLPVAAVPLRVDGIWLAAAVCGRSAPPGALDEERLRRRARGLRLRLDDLRAALAEAPAVSEDRLRAFALHVGAMLQALSELAEARLAEARSRQALEVTNHRLGALWAIAASIIRSSSLEEAFGEALQTILDLLQLESGAIFLRHNGGPGALLAAHRGVRPEYAALAADVLAFGGMAGGHLAPGGAEATADWGFRGRPTAGRRGYAGRSDGAHPGAAGLPG